MKFSLVIALVMGIIHSQEVLGCGGGRRGGRGGGRPPPPPSGGGGDGGPGGGGSSRKCFVQICGGNPTNRMRSDSQGDGAYLARRGSRLHRGYDIVCSVGASVYAPFPARVLGVTRPYGPGSSHWEAVYNTGVSMEGTGSWAGYKVKMWYVSRRVRTGDSVSAGDVVGTMTNRAAPSRGMINHVHVQLMKDDVIVNPTPYIC